MFENLLTKLNKLTYDYLKFFIKSVNNILYSFLQTIMFQNIELYL